MPDLKNPIDMVDLDILRLLKDDGRMALNELAVVVGMSAPGVAERVRRLESRNFIKRFTIDIDLSAMGFEIEAIVRIKPRSGSLHRVEQMIISEERFTACDKVTGDDCFIARLALMSISELDPILVPFHDIAETHTSIVKSSPIVNRQPIAPGQLR